MQCSGNEGPEKRGASLSPFPKSEHRGEAPYRLPAAFEMGAFGRDVSKLVEEEDLMRKICLQKLR